MFNKNKKREETMKIRIRNHSVSILVSLLICFTSTVLLWPVIVGGQEEQYPGQGKDQLVDALDAAIARVLESGQWRAIMNSDPVVTPLAVNIADCYPRIVEEEVEIYPFPQNPTGLLKDILDSKQIKVGTYDAEGIPGTFHIFDNVNPDLMRAIIDELGVGYGIPSSPDPGAIQIVRVDVWPPSSSLLFDMLNNGDFDITDFNAALGATANKKRRRKLARFTCTIFGTPWYIHVKDTSSYQTIDDVLADTDAILCAGMLSSRLSEDFFQDQTIVKQFSDDLNVCSQGVSDGTYNGYLHFDPVPALPDLRLLATGIVSGIPIWVAGDTAHDATTTTTATEPPCVSEELYGEYSEQTELLRNFRDEVLSKSEVGQALLTLYYQWSPVIVKAMEENEEFKEEVKEMIDGVLSLIENTFE